MPENALSSLYPQPSKPDAGMLSGDPSKVIGIIGALNQNALFQKQFPALSQQPEAALQGQNISNQSAQMKQNEEGAQIVAGHLGTLPDNAKPEDFYRMKAAIRAIHPNISASTINTVADIALREPTGLRNGIATLRTMGVSPAERVGRVAAPPGPQNEPMQQPLTSAIRAGAQPVGPVPGAAEAQVQTGVGAANAYTAASEAAGNYGQRINPLRQAIPILENMKETDIGPTSERWNDIKSTAVSLGAGRLAGIDPDKIKDFNELNKYFKQYSAQVGATMGPKTNDGLATAVTSNPNVSMDRLSAFELSKVALGVERMKQAGVLEFNAKVDRGEAIPADFNKFMVNWGTKQDPRAFVYDLMSKDQQEKLKKTLPPAELKKIRDGMNIADRHGLLGDVHQ